MIYCGCGRREPSALHFLSNGCTSQNLHSSTGNNWKHYKSIKAPPSYILRLQKYNFVKYFLKLFYHNAYSPNIKSNLVYYCLIKNNNIYTEIYTVNEKGTGRYYSACPSDFAKISAVALSFSALSFLRLSRICSYISFVTDSDAWPS